MLLFVELLNKIAQQVNIVVGITFFLFGLIGNCLNILIFSSLFKTKLFPQTPGRLYLLTISIADLIFVIYLLSTRILISGFFIPITNTSNFLCKSRFYFGQVCMFTSLFGNCLAIIDQFLITSRSVRVRQLSRLSLARKLIIVSIIVWCLINIPSLFLYKIYPDADGKSAVCTTYSSFWIFYYTYFQNLIFLCLIPLSVFIIYGILTRNNLRSVRQPRQSITRQMTRMVLLQSMTMALSLLIAAIQIIYQSVTVNTEKDVVRTAQDNMFNTVANLLTYVNYIAGFYIYLFSSKSLRQKLKNILLNRQPTPVVNLRIRLTQN